MPDRSKAPLVELQEVEERLAVRTARIDQLQAAVDSSQLRSLRFGRALFIVGSISALATAFFGLRQSNEWILNILLALAAVGLIFVTGIFSSAMRRFASGRDRLPMPLESMFVWWIRRSLSWQSEARLSHSTWQLWRSVSSRPGLWLLATATVVPAAVLFLGSAALAGFALLIVLGLLRIVWSRQVAAPGMVQVAGPLVALAAALSLGTSIGSVSGELFRIQDQSPERATRSVAPPTYEDLCPARAPWSAGTPSPGLLQLREAWLEDGAVVAGCPTPMRAASVGPGVVMSLGVVDGQIRSIGFANRHRGTILLDEAALIARRLAGTGALRGVPRHLVVGGGDLYLLQSNRGTFVLTRRETGSPGRQFARQEPSHYGRYLVLGPATAGLWVEAMSRRGEWLWPSREGHRPGLRGLRFLNQASAVVARRSCGPASGSCGLSMTDGTLLRPGTGPQVSANQILRYAPSP